MHLSPISALCVFNSPGIWDLPYHWVVCLTVTSSFGHRCILRCPASTCLTGLSSTAGMYFFPFHDLGVRLDCTLDKERQYGDQKSQVHEQMVSFFVVLLFPFLVDLLHFAKGLSGHQIGSVFLHGSIQTGRNRLCHMRLGQMGWALMVNRKCFLLAVIVQREEDEEELDQSTGFLEQGFSRAGTVWGESVLLSSGLQPLFPQEEGRRKERAGQ